MQFAFLDMLWTIPAPLSLAGSRGLGTHDAAAAHINLTSPAAACMLASALQAP